MRRVARGANLAIVAAMGMRDRRLRQAKRRRGGSVAAQLSQISEVSKNARTTWFGLIFLLLFCGVTLLDVRDRDFFEYGAATQLPLLNVSVPVVGFFITAPLLILGLYVYLHVYLAKLWLELGEIEARPNGVDLDRAVFPWLISDAALRLREDVPRRAFGWISWLSALLLGWVFGPVVIAAFWVRSWPYHHEGLTLWIGLLLLIALWIGSDSWRVRRNAMRGREARRAWWRWPVGALLGTVIAAVSWETTEGGWLSNLPNGIKVWIEAQHAKNFPKERWEDPWKLDGMAFLYPADLSGAELVEMPPGWMGRDRALREYRRKHGDAHRTERQEDPDAPDLATEFEEQRRERRAALNADSFARADLRGADLSGAFLVGADLTAARLEGAYLREARLEGAYLWAARLEGAYLWAARLEGADLRGARLDGANLYRARLEGANLIGARLEGAYLGEARLEGADLGGARLEGANLREASFKSAKLALSTNDFGNASFADFTGAEGLTQAMVDSMFGNAATTLPDGLIRPEHWSTEDEDLEESNKDYCAWLKSEGQESRVCQ